MDYSIAKECTFLSEQEKITFPEVVQRLAKAEIEFYYADLVAQSKTYYGKHEAFVIPCLKNLEKEGDHQFNADKVAEAIRLIQMGKIQYQEFLQRIIKAGVVAYFVFIQGCKALYLGKLGEQYIENFP